MKNRSRPLLMLSFVLALAGCTTWAPATHLDVPPSPDQRILVWAGGSEYDLHGIAISDTALTGVPHWQSLQQQQLPDENRVTIPLAEVDSIQQRNISPSRTVVLFSLPAALVITILVAFGIHGPPS